MAYNWPALIHSDPSIKSDRKHHLQFLFFPQGKIEDNMPAFMLLPPTAFAEEQPGMVAALRENAKGLTSHLDIYN